MNNQLEDICQPKDREGALTERRRLKMARSAHAYVRGSTLKFYEWLESSTARTLPQGPPVWICGDCHLGNLGPVANAKGKVKVAIRDLDQTVIGNPAHDLIRLGLSLATSIRSSDLPGVTTALMLEHMIEGHESQLVSIKQTRKQSGAAPASVRDVLKRALKRRWHHLAEERIEDVTPVIPLGRCFWPLSKAERSEIDKLFQAKDVQHLITSLKDREDGDKVKVLDAAYWMTGCSSLGYSGRYLLLRVGSGHLNTLDNPVRCERPDAAELNPVDGVVLAEDVSVEDVYDDGGSDHQDRKETVGTHVEFSLCRVVYKPHRVRSLTVNSPRRSLSEARTVSSPRRQSITLGSCSNSKKDNRSSGSSNLRTQYFPL
jgi:Uncharacterized protein conserved in bacteria (DUF2252)